MSQNSLNIEDEYLGDGVYVSFDDYHVWLDLRAQNPAIKIALEPPVLKRFFKYIERIEDEGKKHKQV